MYLLKLRRERARSCPLSTQPKFANAKYASQGVIHRRTESAILEGTKKLIAQQGLSNISMIEIADESQVSRATLYNHYRDKNAVIQALITSEAHRLIEIASHASSAAQALEEISIAISSDSALASMRIHDKGALTDLLSHSEDKLYLELATCIFSLTKSEAGTGLAMRWLLGQVSQPVSAKQSHDQAQLLVANTNAHL
jgi:TetR/AcrR family transcriptional regulator, transcriptional repressor of aconitase